jgi:hypothetical protein
LHTHASILVLHYRLLAIRTALPTMRSERQNRAKKAVLARYTRASRGQSDRKIRATIELAQVGVR